MAYGTRHIVSTHWGTFSLDDGAYRDYLAGRLWISWTPGDSRNTPPSISGAPVIPPNITEGALRLRDTADKNGIIETIRENFPGATVKVPYRDYMHDISIYELTLSIRSSNGLMRAGADTYGKLVQILESERGLLGIRNLGAKSSKEILHAFFSDTYCRLSAVEKAGYWQELLDGSFPLPSCRGQQPE